MSAGRTAPVRIGCGAGFSGDRIEPAVELAEHGALDYLVFECLAERTVALAQRAKRSDPGAGYDPGLDRRMAAVLPACAARGVKIVTNMGAANPEAAAARVAALARELGLGRLRVAWVGGDDVREQVIAADPPLLELPGRVSSLGRDRVVSANAYLGAGPIVEALALGADVVITGRAADPSLFLAPLMHEFGWRPDDWPRLGRGTLVGHLLECAGQLTGGYFAEPGRKDVADLARLGFPIAEVDAAGDAIFGKVAGSGGTLSVRTCTEQLLYEIGDPAAYPTPDVLADFSGVEFRELRPDRIAVRGGGGRAAPVKLKVSVGYLAGFAGEGQISYAGESAVARGRLAIEIVRERLRITGVELEELRAELIGVDAVYPGARPAGAPAEVRVRVAGRAASLTAVERIGAEVESLYTNGPSGGGGVHRSAGAVIAIASTLISREAAAGVVRMLS
ncbi:MAG TPA: acyclic terpene utilization AtuA family protein [Caulobacteraceae bacterium]|jgi:hypothetical protein|nr:acyclic terpene utilization AtuA family protein [Caulobacteraceae bacterium]